MASACSLACSHVSVAETHLPASLWYWDPTRFASAKVMFMCRVWASETDSCSFSSSVSRSTNCFSISSLSSGSLPPQSVDQHNWCHSYAVISNKSSKYMHGEHFKILINSWHNLLFNGANWPRNTYQVNQPTVYNANWWSILLKHITCEDWFKKEKALQQQKAFST